MSPSFWSGQNGWKFWMILIEQPNEVRQVVAILGVRAWDRGLERRHAQCSRQGTGDNKSHGKEQWWWSMLERHSEGEEWRSHLINSRESRVCRRERKWTPRKEENWQKRVGHSKKTVWRITKWQRVKYCKEVKYDELNIY